MNTSIKTILVSLLILLAILIPFLLWGEKADAFFEEWVNRLNKHKWETSAALSTILAIDIVTPVPSSLVSTACGTLLGFWWGAATSFVGMTLGSAAGFFIARGLHKVGRWRPRLAAQHESYWVGRRRPRLAESVVRLGEDAVALPSWFARHGVLALAALRPVPMLAEASVLFAGASALHAKRVLLTLALSNAAVSALYAGIGSLGAGTGGIALAFLASILVAGALMLLFRKYGNR